MKNKIYLSLGLVSILFLFSQCIIPWGEDCEKEKGEIVRKEISISEFSKLKLKGSSTVYLLQGDQQKVEIESTENIIAILKTKVDKEAWTIDFERCLKTKKGVKFYITMEDIEALQVMGSGDIIGKDEIKSKNLTLDIKGSGDIKIEVQAKEINAEIKGSGDMEVKGESDKLSASVMGSGDFKGIDLKSEEVIAKVKGSGDLEVYAKKSISASVNGSGDIVYDGKPDDVSSNTNGSGSISAK